MKKSWLTLLAGALALCFVTAAVPAVAQESTVVSDDRAHNWETVFPDGLIKAGQKATAAKTANVKLLDGKFVGIYNSASWCGPCRLFTPQLVKFYKKHKANLEIVFNSKDKSEKEMLDYVKKDKMKWLAVPYGKKPNYRSSTGGIPHLTIFSPDGEVFKEISGASGATPDPRLEKLAEEMTGWLEENKKSK